MPAYAQHFLLSSSAQTLFASTSPWLFRCHLLQEALPDLCLSPSRRWVLPPLSSTHCHLSLTTQMIRDFTRTRLVMVMVDRLQRPGRTEPAGCIRSPAWSQRQWSQSHSRALGWGDVRLIPAPSGHRVEVHGKGRGLGRQTGRGAVGSQCTSRPAQ